MLGDAHQGCSQVGGCWPVPTGHLPDFCRTILLLSRLSQPRLLVVLSTAIPTLALQTLTWVQRRVRRHRG